MFCFCSPKYRLSAISPHPPARNSALEATLMWQLRQYSVIESPIRGHYCHPPSLITVSRRLCRHRSNGFARHRALR
jgi:hypothetical protein